MKNLNRKFRKIECEKDEVMGDCYRMWLNSDDINCVNRVPYMKTFKREWNQSFHYSEYPVINTVTIFKKLGE